MFIEIKYNNCIIILTILFIFFRVLGKFGGGNRKMMTEPQRLDYKIHRQSKKPAIIIKFIEHTESVTFNVDMVCIYIYKKKNCVINNYIYF